MGEKILRNFFPIIRGGEFSMLAIGWIFLLFSFGLGMFGLYYALRTAPVIRGCARCGAEEWQFNLCWHCGKGLRLVK